jgi:hypothetical protein
MVNERGRVRDFLCALDKNHHEITPRARLRRLMCGKALPFRPGLLPSCAQLNGSRRSLEPLGEGIKRLPFR